MSELEGSFSSAGDTPGAAEGTKIRYLHPPAQQRLLSGAADCLEVIELAVNWEAEKLYGVAGLGPFDEF